MVNLVPCITFRCKNKFAKIRLQVFFRFGFQVSLPTVELPFFCVRIPKCHGRHCRWFHKHFLFRFH